MKMFFPNSARPYQNDSLILPVMGQKKEAVSDLLQHNHVHQVFKTGKKNDTVSTVWIAKNRKGVNCSKRKLSRNDPKKRTKRKMKKRLTTLGNRKHALRHYF